ncbi:MAG TPA: helical backbone metal receptor [Sphingobacteriaceae bacterium]|nr:helical backbone metal receptor [Sphingobacteriaceae bacterium]
MSSNTFTDQIGRTIIVKSTPKRIISVVPSQTELLFDLGLNTEIIGITKFCVHPEDKVSLIPKIGGTKSLNIQKIRELKPDLIIANKEENQKDQIEQLMQEFPVWVSDIHNLHESMKMIEDVGELVDRQQQAKTLVKDIVSSFDTVSSLPHPLHVAYFIWKDPYMVAAQNTFINTMLIAAGWQNAFQNFRYPVISEKDIITANPEVIFLSSEPYPFKEKHIAEFKLLCPAAKVIVVDGELFSWYGSRLKYTADYLKKLQLHVNQ